MKATLEFNLPEEAHEFYIATRATRMSIEISITREKIRSWLKHGHEFKTPDDALIAVRSELLEAFQLIEEP
jgi:hypothetical protein